MFSSILFPTLEQFEMSRQSEPPACFSDLNLDQIVSAALRNESEYSMESYFYTPVKDIEIILFRQHVMKELQNSEAVNSLNGFSKTVYAIGRNMDMLKQDMAHDESVNGRYLAQGHMLNCAEQYCHAVIDLSESIANLHLHSEGLTGFASYLKEYRNSEAFKKFNSTAAEIRKEFSGLQYCMLIKNGTVKVRKYEEQEDYSKEIIRVFDKFRQNDTKDYRHKLSEEPAAEHVEAAVLAMLSRVYPEQFRKLDAFCREYMDFYDETLIRFAREIRFYLCWLDMIRPLKEAGLSFCYPQVSADTQHLHADRFFDLALALKIRGSIVVNDFTLDAPERIIVVTGPNQGGKTTFARAFGQMHYLASIGLCVPGNDAELQLQDNVLTHFSKEESLETMNGKLQDDLVRLHDLLQKAQKNSVIVINEIFSSTTLKDAVELGSHMMDEIASIGSLCIIVTFMDELAEHGEETVSMMSMADRDNPGRRTYKVCRRPPDGLAYAMYIAGRNGLTYEQLSRRLKP